MKLRAGAAVFLCIFCALLCIPSLSFAQTRYVNVNSTNPAAPFTSWSTAARTIQEAIDVSADGDLILVTNGYYQTGGTTNFPEFSELTNRVAITKSNTVQSVNGPGVTFIVGGGSLGDAAIRGVAMAPGAVLSGFTISNGYTMTSGEYSIEKSGGGVWCSDQTCVLTNCIIADNKAAWYGGGVYQGTLYNCTVMRSFSSNAGGGVYWGALNACTVRGNISFRGGGAYYGTLYNCTVASNFAYYGGGSYNGDLYHCTVVTNVAEQFGGGVYEGTLENCIVYYNSVVATNQNENWYNGTITYTCTDTLPTGDGNITNEPVLASLLAGNFRLMSNSPCIDAGTNDVAALDKDGIPRPLDGNLDGTNTADMGAYEFVHGAGDSDKDGMLDPWEIEYDLNPLDPADAALDPDSDRQVSLEEFIAGTIPTNGASYFSIKRMRNRATNELVTWNSAAGRVYKLEVMPDMTGDTWSVAASGLLAYPPENTYTDAVLSNVDYYYRVWVHRTNAYYPP